MEKKVRIALLGLGGYAGVYLDYMEHHIDPQTFIFAGLIDPYAKQAPRYERFKMHNVPEYNTLEEFYTDNKADLVIVSTPVKFHKPHSIIAMANGSHVLCEKPLVPIIQDALELKQAQEKYNKQLGVGFQLSFSKPLLELKKDMINGEFGKPLEFKSFTSYRRFDDYYNDSDWKGRVKNKNGEWILDSVSTNATAHYIFNLCFMGGDKIETSAMPVEAETEIYRAKDIETYDTCFIRGSFKNGCKFYYFSTHSGETEVSSIVSYKFENAVITMGGKSGGEIIAEYNDGRIKNYGDTSSGDRQAEKLTTMMAVVRGEAELPCGIDTVMPHIVISNAIFDQAEFNNFPKEVCFRSENPSGTFVRNLIEESQKCHEVMKFPSEMGYSWAASSPSKLTINGYDKFCGDKYK